MNRTIKIVFDNATQEQVDQVSDLVTDALELAGIVAVIFVDEETDNEET